MFTNRTCQLATFQDLLKVSGGTHAVTWKKKPSVTYGSFSSAASYKAVKVDLVQQPDGWFIRHTAAASRLHFFLRYVRHFLFFKGCQLQQPLPSP